MKQHKNSQKNYSDQKILQAVSEQDLQAVTGGCLGCQAVASVAVERGKKASQDFFAMRNPNSAPANAELDRALALQSVAVRAGANYSHPRIPGCAHCDKLGGFVKELGPHL